MKSDYGLAIVVGSPTKSNTKRPHCWFLGVSQSCRRLEVGRRGNSQKAVEGHHTPKALPFEWYNPNDLERGSPLPLFPQRAMQRPLRGLESI